MVTELLEAASRIAVNAGREIDADAIGELARWITASIDAGMSRDAMRENILSLMNDVIAVTPHKKLRRRDFQPFLRDKPVEPPSYTWPPAESVKWFRDEPFYSTNDHAEFEIHHSEPPPGSIVGSHMPDAMAPNSDPQPRKPRQKQPKPPKLITPDKVQPKGKKRSVTGVPKMASPPLEMAPPPLEMAPPPQAEFIPDLPPRSVYARLDAPETVVVAVPFNVTVGLAAEQAPNVFGEALELPESTEYPYELAVQIVADGFDFTDANSFRRVLTATANDPYPTAQFELVAREQQEGVRSRALKVIYSVKGQTIGFAIRPISTLREIGVYTPAPEAEAPRVDIRVPTDRVAPDLTIHILRVRNDRGRLTWRVESPHKLGAVQGLNDAETMSCDIGEQPRDFMKRLIQDVNRQEGKPGLALQLKGFGRAIADKFPMPVWDAIRTVAAVRSPPTILILSEEPHIPWELAIMAKPLPVADAPPFLGAQAAVGRWVLGQARPQLPPPHEHVVNSLGVVWGKYDLAKWKRLEGAEQEAEMLRREYGAQSIDAQTPTVMNCLKNDPAVDALHFALHGIYSPGGIEDGLVLVDGQVINPLQISGADLSSRPFVFLNACQVGGEQELLGDYAGMASAFLDASASAVVAPLWSVKDTIAKEICDTFYQETLRGNQPVAEVLRRQRARYADGDSATYLAYQFYGHPELRLNRPGGQ